MFDLRERNRARSFGKIERIQQPHSDTVQVLHVSRNQRQIVRLGGCGDQTVGGGEGTNGIHSATFFRHCGVYFRERDRYMRRTDWRATIPTELPPLDRASRSARSLCGFRPEPGRLRKVPTTGSAGSTRQQPDGNASAFAAPTARSCREGTWLTRRNRLHACRPARG